MQATEQQQQPIDNNNTNNNNNNILINSSSNNISINPNSIITPHHTLYLNNLNERVKIHELRRSLYLLFSQFGNILDIKINNKKYKLKGQAWIIYSSISSSTSAIQTLKNFIFYEKILNINYAKQESDTIILKQNPNIKRIQRPKRKNLEDKILEGTTANKIHQINKQERIKKQLNEKQNQLINNNNSNNITNINNNSISLSIPPNRILFVENLPVETTELMLSMLFQQYTGYVESRLVPNRPGIAFIEFNNSNQANIAMDALQGFKITPTNLMKITFAKK